jgi:peptidoglycan DL-endopeptidase CwlO
MEEASTLNPSISRRSFALLAAGLPVAAGLLGGAFARAALATQETADALAQAQADYFAAQQQYNDIVAQYQQLCSDCSVIQSQIEQQVAQVTSLLDQIDALYAAGGDSPDTAAIAELQAQQDSANAQIAELRVLAEQKSGLLAQMKASQDSAAELLNTLQGKVDTLSEQYNQELVEEAEAQRQADEQAQAQQQASAATSEQAQAQSTTDADAQAKAASAAKAAEEEAKTVSQAQAAALTAESRAELQKLLAMGLDGQSYGGTSLARVIQAASTVDCPGAGWCAQWVSDVFRQAGIGSYDGDACDLYWAYCTSSDRSRLQPGMIVAIPSHNYTDDGQIYGHVGIYVGNNLVFDSLSYIRHKNVDEWIDFYNAGKGNPDAPVKWGWMGGVALTSKTGFCDVLDDAWYTDCIAYVQEAGIMRGYESNGQLTGYFGPEDQVTRAMAATVLCRHFLGGQDQDSWGGFFDDVAGDEWYAGAVEWCYMQGVVTGDTDDDGNELGTFRPNDTVTREELATMVHRYAQCLDDKDEGDDISGYPDAADVSDFALEHLQWCHAKGVITGKEMSDASYLAPQETATRAQLAKIMTVLVRDVLASRTDG